MNQTAINGFHRRRVHLIFPVKTISRGVAMFALVVSVQNSVGGGQHKIGWQPIILSPSNCSSNSSPKINPATFSFRHTARQRRCRWRQMARRAKPKPEMQQVLETSTLLGGIERGVQGRCRFAHSNDTNVILTTANALWYRQGAQ